MRSSNASILPASRCCMLGAPACHANLAQPNRLQEPPCAPHIRVFAGGPDWCWLLLPFCPACTQHLQLLAWLPSGHAFRADVDCTMMRPPSKRYRHTGLSKVRSWPLCYGLQPHSSKVRSWPLCYGLQPHSCSDCCNTQLAANCGQFEY
jgi:hypothetical protein